MNRDPDRLDSPLRRVGMGSFAGVMIGVVIMAGFGVFGLATSGGKASSWKDADSAVVVDSQAGLVFWYTQKRLHPMENITSAKLANGGGDVTTLKTKSLKDVPRDKLLGIRDAPRQLPDAADMGAYPMQACTTAPNAQQTRFTTLTMGDPRLQIGEDTAVAMRGPTGDFYLVVNGTAHRVPKEESQDVPPLLLEYEVLQPTYGLLNALPQGSPLDAEAIMKRVPGADELDTSKPIREATRVGQLVHVGGQSTRYVMLADGLSKITPLEHAALQVSRPNAPSIEVTAQEASLNLSETRDMGAADLPSEMPKVLKGQQEQAKSVCATWTAANQPPRLSTGNPTPEVGTSAANPANADIVVVPPLRGALIRNEEAKQGPAVTLVTEGKRFSVPDADSLNALGYAQVAQDAVPAQLMGLIPPGLPIGQTLSIAAAQTESRPT
ncbi:MAG: type VII secretion protein EccB [Propionibacteriales bacterium]|nr:type VII secretion protein EccB [Propionibacteriales bacterium]